MIRVLHIVTHMNRGGLETMIMNYYRYIDRKKIQFDFLVHRNEQADYDEEIQQLGGNIYRLPILNPMSIGYRNAVDKFFETHQEYRIVHCHLDCLSSIPLQYAKKWHIPVRIAHAHNTNQEKNIKYIIKQKYKKQIPRYANYLFACSHDAGKWMFNGKPFIVMRNAINSKSFSYNPAVRKVMRNMFGVSDNQFIIGHIGRFNKQKNHKFLINIFVEILKKEPNAILLLVGDGNLRQDIQQICKDSRIENHVIFTGVRADIEKIVQVIDVFVFPSLFEGLPVTMVEAQAAGLPCVISDKIPSETIITDGLVSVKSLDESAGLWAEHIIAKRQHQRYDRAKEIQKSGFDICTSVEWLTNMYTKMLQSHE